MENSSQYKRESTGSGGKSNRRNCDTCKGKEAESIFRIPEIKNNDPSHLSGVRVATSALIGRRILLSDYPIIDITIQPTSAKPTAG